MGILKIVGKNCGNFKIFGGKSALIHLVTLMSYDGNVFFANFLSRHHLSSCLQARAASQSSELSSAADARRKLEEDVSRLRAETDNALKESNKKDGEF